MTILLYVLLIVVALTLVAGAVAVGSLAYDHARDVLRMSRGMATEVWCPHYQQHTLARVGMAENGHYLMVLTCERQTSGVIRCDAACFPAIAKRLTRPVVKAS